MAKSDALYEKVKRIDSSITFKKVSDWYSKQRYGDNRKKLPLFKITSHNPNSWQIDLAFVRNKAIFTAININSRIGYAKLIPNKKATSVVKVLKELTKLHKVDVLTSDNGKEFLNHVIQKFVKENGLEHFNNEVGDHNTMGKIERFNRTLKQRLMRVGNNIPLTQELLNSLIENYNNSKHSAIKATPNEMKGQVIESELEHNQELAPEVDYHFNVGDNVLYKLPKKTFGKETVKWSKTVYGVVGMDGYRVEIRSKNGHILYKPHNELRHVSAKQSTVAPIKDQQLFEVEEILDHKPQRNGKNTYLVKWKGYDETTREPESNLRLINKNRPSEAEKKYFNKTKSNK